jgi:hypothetical protein
VSFRSIPARTALSAALVTVLVAGTASAQQPAEGPAAQPAPAASQPAPGPAAQPPPPGVPPPGQPPPPPPAPKETDGVRFRGGVALEGGGILVPDIINLGMAGIQGQLGVQINNSFGAYVVPSFAVVVGDMYGIHLGAAALFDYTFLDNLLTVGAGPDVAALAAFGAPAAGIGIAAAGGSLYGGRLHFAVHPAVGIGANGIRRKAFTIAVDVRLYGGGAGFASSGTAGATAKVADFVAAPSLSIGYTAF